MCVGGAPLTQSCTTHNLATQVVFATAGGLLEDSKGQGAAALLRYKIIILDEVLEFCSAVAVLL